MVTRLVVSTQRNTHTDVKIKIFIPPGREGISPPLMRAPPPYVPLCMRSIFLLLDLLLGGLLSQELSDAYIYIYVCVCVCVKYRNRKVIFRMFVVRDESGGEVGDRAGPRLCNGPTSVHSRQTHAEKKHL